MAKIHIHVHDGKTRDSEPLSEEEFKSAVSSTNSLLTDASRKAADLSGRAAIAGGASKRAQRLEGLIDDARKYAFQIR